MFWIALVLFVAIIGVTGALNLPSREFAHTALGWKLNGELTAELRVQSDESSSAGATSPTFLGALTGGGTVVCPVFYNGSAWVAG